MSGLEMSLLGLTVPGNAFIQVFRTGSSVSHWYRLTVPSYASTVALTELRM